MLPRVERLFAVHYKIDPRTSLKKMSTPDEMLVEEEVLVGEASLNEEYDPSNSYNVGIEDIQTEQMQNEKNLPLVDQLQKTVADAKEMILDLLNEIADLKVSSI